ncbi:MAG: FAD-dependent oxidoreductase, partial [Dermabacter sp.]|nr:FAD-dependent oxidoreductase [Dermabacter sp.]
MADTSTDQKFDIVILGGGSGGYAAALRATQLGKSVALVEKDKLGGTCLHRGCVPTKALLHVGEIADTPAEAKAVGIEMTASAVNTEKMLDFKNKVIGRLYKGLQGLVGASGATLVNGFGRLTGPNTIEVEAEDGSKQTLTGDNIILASGSFSKTLPGLELGGRIIDSEVALQLPEVPKNPIILGGGVIGVEFA